MSPYFSWQDTRTAKWSSGYFSDLGVASTLLCLDFGSSREWFFTFAVRRQAEFLPLIELPYVQIGGQWSTNSFFVGRSCDKGADEAIDF